MNAARLVPAISAPFDWEISPCEYHNSAAATRISFTNSVGDKRRADSAPSGTSNVTVAMMTSVVRIRPSRSFWPVSALSTVYGTSALGRRRADPARLRRGQLRLYRQVPQG